jgi:hypothetical protein
MASIIKIKRSTGTSAPSSLKSGELAYSYGAGTQADNGDRLFFGSGDNGSGNATSVVTIGGKYFADLLDHVHGQLTASSAIITDANSKINNIKIDNIDIDGNTISTTNANGSLVLDPNGTGHINVSGAVVKNAGTPTVGTDLATKGYVDQVSGAALFTFNGDAGSDTVNLADSSLNFVTGPGLTSNVTDNTVTTSIDSTGVVAGSYGSSTEIPVFSVNERGQIDSAGSVSVTFDLTLAGDASSTDTFSTGETLTFAGTDPVQAVVTDNTITISVDNATTSTKGIAQFSSDDFSVSTGIVTIKASGVANAQLENNSITINGTSISLGDSATYTTTDINEGDNQYFTTQRARQSISLVDNGGDGSLEYSDSTGVFTYTGPSATEVRAHFSAGTGVDITNGEVSIGQSVGTSDDVTFQDVIVSGNLVVQGGTTTVSTETLTVQDPLIHLADSNDTTDAVDIGFVAKYYDTNDSRIEHTGLFRDASDGKYKLFTGLVAPDLEDSSNNVDINGTGFTYADLTVAELTATTINSTLVGSYTGFDSDFTNQTTNNLPEGDSNLYYTTARATEDARNAISVGEGLDYSDSTGLITAELASYTNLGVASFNSTNFTVAAGAVSSNDITITTGDTNTKTINNGGSLNLNGNSNAGITTSTVSGNIEISAASSTNVQRGTAAFDSINFNVLAGMVTVSQIDGGTY